MTNEPRTVPHAGTGGEGRLAALIATRGGLAAPEEPFVIEHREALIYMLCEAAELEHAIMCQYLFAVFSLKQTADEGLSDAEVDAVGRWRRQISHVATQEMLHLALVENILSAIGAAPHFSRPNLPAPASHYPAGVQLVLLPFGEQALRHFMFLERPEGMDLSDAEGLAAVARAVPAMSDLDIVPRGQDFATIGHLYRSIEAGLARLADKHGEDWLFVGPPRAQATERYFGWPELVAVTDLASAQCAIDEILEQGEGPRGNWRDAHFGQFVAILDEYRQLKSANPEFDPVRPVMAANVRQPERDVAVPLISDRLTARVADLFNVGYEILLQVFQRFFAHTEESDAQLQILADATVALMIKMLKPLGDLLTTLPIGHDHPGMTAGASFELFYETDYLLPHRDAAWALLAERLDVAGRLCDELRAAHGRDLGGSLAPVQAAMREIAQSLAAHLPATSSHAYLADGQPGLEPAELDQLLSRAGELTGTASNKRNELAAVSRAAYSIIAAAASGAGCDAGEQAVIVPRLVDSVLRPLADALSAPESAPESASESAPESAPEKAPATGQPGTERSAARPGDAAESAAAPERPNQAARVWELAKTATALRARLGGEGACPPELAEATAALQDLAVKLAPAGQASARLDELWRLQSGLRIVVQAEHNGPYLATNVPTLADYLGGERRPAPQLALCRCGASSMKPLCDGSHARVGFTEAKDPDRVPDHRDVYDGQQVRILDNRGICQHSGLCTDRLAAVFRTNAEPFVAPSGGRMDEIIRAIRDCPSGALSYAIDGTEAREQVDWDGTRPPAIEVTKDGPYRIRGHIPLLDAGGNPAARAEGASLEHYALCRCGQSQNKPFCSGMHWYVDFTDPVPPPGHEPSLYEWAGGRPALVRMGRLLYEKHVPADGGLATVFADMPADQPQRLARWIGAALGDPAAEKQGCDVRGAIGLSGWASGEDRSRWVALVTRSADEAGLPADAGFRAAFASCIEWLSRAVDAAATPPAATPPAATPPAVVPRWDWGPGGPPQATPSEQPKESIADVSLPGPDETVSYQAHIKPLFREHDQQSMSKAFDLWSYDDVRARASEILEKLQDGSMPCDGAWPEARTAVFQRWTETGMQP
jgi:CDGSH-type Zn-finger protein/truncated hemoglobin YjbI